MADTTFVKNITPIKAEWLNDVNDTVYKQVSNVKLFGAKGDGVTDDTAAIQAAINIGNPVFLPDYSYSSTALTTSKPIEWATGRYNGDISLSDPIDQSNMSDAPQLIYPSIGGKHSYSVRNGSLTGNDIYDPIFPNIKHFDSLNGVTQVVSGSVIEHAAGISGYIRTDTAAPTNAVALFGCGMATVNNAAVWGINTLLQDQSTRTAGALTGIVLANEFDFNVMNAGTEIIGLSLGGNSLAQPSVSNAYIVNKLGTGIKWGSAFLVQDGACSDVALGAGMMSATGNNISSTKVLFSATNNAGTKVSSPLQLIGFSAPFLQLSNSNFKISFNDLLLDTGHGVLINGDTIISDRRTGWAATTGAEIRTDFGDASLSDTSQALRALIVDLKAHGVIGL